MAQEPAKRLYDGGSTSVLYTDRRDFYISPNVVKELWSDVTPFLSAISSWDQRSGMKDPMYKMFEARAYWVDQRFTCADTDTFTAGSDSAVTVTLPASTSTNTIGLAGGVSGTRNASYRGLVCSVHANDAATSKPAATRKGVVVITVYTSDTEIGAKCIGPTFTLVSGDWFVVIGTASGENTTAFTPWSDELTTVWNQAGIMRTSLQISGTMKQAVLRGETSEYMRLRNRKIAEHKIQKARMMLFSSSALGTNLSAADTFADAGTTDADANEIRTTTGAYEALQKYGATSGDNQNVFTIPEASYTYNNFVDDSEKIFQYYPEDGVKTVFCGAAFMSYFSKVGQSGFTGNSGWKVQMSDFKRDGKIGFNFKLLETPHGILQLVHDPCITRSPYNKSGMVIDKDNIFHAVYRPSMYKQNIITENGYDGQKDEIFSDEGIGMTSLPAHKLLKLS